MARLVVIVVSQWTILLLSPSNVFCPMVFKLPYLISHFTDILVYKSHNMADKLDLLCNSTFGNFQVRNDYLEAPNIQWHLGLRS